MTMETQSKQVVQQTALSDAQTLVAEEQTRLRAEIEAFEIFIDRLDEIPVHTCRPDGGALMVSIQSHSHSSSKPQQAVTTAYQETVLAVDHWQTAYREETVNESIANEFSPEIAAGLSSDGTWSSALYQQLQAESQQAINERQQSLAVLTDELTQLETLAESLNAITDELVDVERGQGSFADRSDQLADIETRLEQLADDHQTYRHEQQSTDRALLSNVVYTDLTTTNPGLDAIATARSLFDQIELHHWASYI